MSVRRQSPVHPGPAEAGAHADQQGVDAVVTGNHALQPVRRRSLLDESALRQPLDPCKHADLRQIQRTGWQLRSSVGAEAAAFGVCQLGSYSATLRLRRPRRNATSITGAWRHAWSLNMPLACVQKIAAKRR